MKSEARARASREAYRLGLHEAIEEASLSVSLREALSGLALRMLRGGVSVDQVVSAVEALPLATPEDLDREHARRRRATSYCARCGDDALPDWSPPVCDDCARRG